MGKRMVRVGSYWKRRQLGPDHKGLGTPWELHMEIPVGGFVQVLENPFHPQKGTVVFCEVGKDRTDYLTTRLFKMYFSEVKSKNELGLIKLMEM